MNLLKKALINFMVQDRLKLKQARKSLIMTHL